MFLNFFTSYLIWARLCRDNLFVPVSGPHPTFGLAESRPDLDCSRADGCGFDLFCLFHLPYALPQYCNQFIPLLCVFLNVFTSYLIWARHCRDNLFVPVSGPHPTFGLAESRPDLDCSRADGCGFDLFFTAFRFWFFPFFFYCLPRRYEWSEEGWMWPFHG